MASLSDMLNSVLDLPANHPVAMQFLSLIPAVGGAALAARTDRWGRPTRLGAPIGAGLQVLGQYGVERGLANEQTAQAQQQNRAMAQLFSDPNLSLQDAITHGGAEGLDLPTIEGTYQALHPAATPRLFSKKGGGFEYIEPKPGKAIPEGDTPYEKPSGESVKPGSFAEWYANERAKNPELDELTARRQWTEAGQKPEKSLSQIQAESDARSRGTLGAFTSTAPLIRFGVYGLSTDGKYQVIPNATMADVDAGKAVALDKADLKQFRQAQVGLAALDQLDQTLNALPKTPGVTSAAGLSGRLLTRVIDPKRLARFNVALVGAGDAYIRAITQRGNQAQFAAAMKSIVDPHATVGSAKESVGQAKALLQDLMDEFTGRGASKGTGALEAATLPTIAAPEPEAATSTDESDEDGTPPPAGYE